MSIVCIVLNKRSIKLYSLEIDVTAFKKLILSSAVADEKLKKLHCQVRFEIHKITINKS